MLAVYSENFEACHRFEPAKKDTHGNHHGVFFYFEPRRSLSDNFHTQSISPIYWAHNTDIKSAINILKDKELIRPSKWIEDPSPNGECSKDGRWKLRSSIAAPSYLGIPVRLQLL